MDELCFFPFFTLGSSGRTQASTPCPSPFDSIFFFISIPVYFLDSTHANCIAFDEKTQSISSRVGILCQAKIMSIRSACSLHTGHNWISSSLRQLSFAVCSMPLEVNRNLLRKIGWWEIFMPKQIESFNRKWRPSLIFRFSQYNFHRNQSKNFWPSHSWHQSNERKKKKRAAACC